MPKITELPSAVSVNDTDTIIVVQDGVTKKASKSMISSTIPTDLIKSDGTIKMSTEYVPVNDKSIVTKDYVDTNVSTLVGTPEVIQYDYIKNYVNPIYNTNGVANAYADHIETSKYLIVPMIDMTFGSMGQVIVFDKFTYDHVHTITRPDNTADMFSGKIALLNDNVLIVGGNPSIFFFDLTTFQPIYEIFNDSYTAYDTNNFGRIVACANGKLYTSVPYGNGESHIITIDVSNVPVSHSLLNVHTTSSAIVFDGLDILCNGTEIIVMTVSEINSEVTLKCYDEDVNNILTLRYEITNPNPIGTTENDMFGMSAFDGPNMSINDNYLVTASYAEDIISDGVLNIDQKYGKVYVYDIHTGALITTIDNPLLTETGFGMYVTIGKNNLISIGAATAQDNINLQILSGVVRLYDINGNFIKEFVNKNATGTPESDYSIIGYAYDDTMLVYAAGENSEQGAFYFYKTMEVFNNGTIYEISKQYTDTKILEQSSNVNNFSIVSTLPSPSLLWLQKIVYVMNDGVYMCVSNFSTPVDSDCVWIQL